MPRRILITSALPSVSGAKHLGNLVSSLLPADVHARFHRQIGNEVLFVCATDEHGTPTEIAAAQAGLDPRSFCDREHARQADVYRRVGLSFRSSWGYPDLSVETSTGRAIVNPDSGVD